MKKLSSIETVLIGKWEFKNGKIAPDDACKRIDWLIANCFDEICVDNREWRVLYRDINDGRLWELTYPFSNMHGCGPPKIESISEKLALKYSAFSNE